MVYHIVSRKAGLLVPHARARFDPNKLGSGSSVKSLVLGENRDKFKNFLGKHEKITLCRRLVAALV